MASIVKHGKEWYLLSEKNDDITLTPLDENRAYPVKDETQNARTAKQNASMHKYFSLISKALNDGGFSMQKVLTQIKKIELSWSMLGVKEVIWREFQKASLGKESTTQLSTTDIDKVYRNVDHWLSDTIGIESIDFPSEESMMINQKLKDN